MTEHGIRARRARLGRDRRRGRGRAAVPLARDPARAVAWTGSGRSPSCSATRSAPTRSIHLTGTNGKTSTSRMIDTLLRALDLRTGRFTSPHVERMSERICIDGEPLTDEEFVRAFNDVAPYTHLVDADQPHPLSFFETVVGMAYAAFADAPVDVAVVEVGMGGSWDATNVADGAVAVVLPIAVDHAHYLGDSPAAIALEKAGIIKPGAIAVLAEQQPDVAEVLLARAAEVGATVVREGIEFGVVSRVPAVGGQMSLAAGPPGAVRRGLPAAVRRAPGAERRRRAGGRRGVRRRPAARRGPGARRVRRGHLAGPARDHPPQPDDRARRRPQPARRRGDRRRARGLLHLRPAHRRDRRDGRQGRRGLLAAFEPHLAHVVCTQNSTDRADAAPTRWPRPRARSSARTGSPSRRGSPTPSTGPRRWPRPARPSATRSAPARCWSPARWSPSARPGRCCRAGDSVSEASDREARPPPRALAAPRHVRRGARARGDHARPDHAGDDHHRRRAGGHAPWSIGLGLAVACLLLAGMLRAAWAYALGWVVQVGGRSASASWSR